jgi:endo-chitodextinase
MHIRSSVPGSRQCAGLAAMLFICLSTWIAPAARAADGEPAAASVTLTVVDVGESVAAGSDIVLRATLSGIASPRRARFFDGGRVIATDRMPPWEYKLRRIRAGTHQFRVEIVGAGSVVASSPIVTVVAVAAPANQPPSVAILSPASNASITQGTAVSLAAEAKDPDGSIARVEYWKGTTLVGTATNPPYQVFYTATTLGSANIVAKAFDNLGASASSVPVSFSVVLPPPSTTAADDAVRLLLQATFGPSRADVDRVRAMGATAWLDEQFRLPITHSHLGYLREVRTLTGMDAGEEHAYEAIWQNYLFGADQLRARVAFALSEIVVISNIAPDQNPWALASWMDMLYRNAFGNYRTLLEEATLQPAMGYYLNMLGNDRENPGEGYRPNENYARELMQLFTIGLVRLNPDGTPARNASGATLPTFDQSVVEGYAQVFTGWNFAGNDTASDDAFYWPPVENWIDPMVPWPKHHSPGAKKLVDGRVLPAGQAPRKDLADALDSLFNHPNAGPFLARRLIQFLVTSNPSPGYVARVAARFDNNGGGVRGDLAAVVRAILADAEARDPTLAMAPTFGKLREPVIRFTHLMRATGAKAANGRNSVWWLDSPEDGLGQSPLLAPSVFNFFSPFFTRPGPIAQAGLVAPELQIHTETQVVGNANFLSSVLWDRGFGFADAGRLRMDLAPWTALAANPTALVDAINLVFTANTLSASTRASMARAAAAVPAGEKAERVRVVLTLLMVAPDFVVQH